ncbi:MAG: LOG family protein [Victivallales bacterium]|nr:LOG family protein [Victivallales bacterium]
MAKKGVKTSPLPDSQWEERIENMRQMLARNTNVRAYEDMDFIHSNVCRAIRLQLEYLKPDVALDLFQVRSTFVIFGSARTKSPEVARKELDAAMKALAKKPGSPEAMQEVQKAEDQLKASHYYQVARDLGALVTRESQKMDNTDKTYVVLTGGGGGIMEAGNRGATEAGGITAALNITLPFEQRPNPYITPELSFLMHYFCIRKMHFLKRARALAAFPGGYGTMDELFEALTLVQTHIIEPMPILLYGKEFWENLINWDFFKERGLISDGDTDLFTYCETAEEGWQVVKDFYAAKKHKGRKKR